MGDFRKLLRLLQEESASQAKLLKILGNERLAIVRLDRNEIEKINLSKDEVVSKAHQLASERIAEMKLIAGITDKKTKVKLDQILDKCASATLRRDLERARDTLRTAAQTVEIVSEHNSRLIKQSMGLIGTTIALMRRAPDEDLPAYGLHGRLTHELPSSATRLGRMISEA